MLPTPPITNRFYTGVGGRKPPADIYELMARAGRVLARLGYVLRSGGAEGSDQAFETGCDSAGGHKEIWRPRDATPDAIEVAKQYHGAWHLCSEHARKLHGRNAFQVLGRYLDSPSAFVLCWTWDSCIHHHDRKKETGGTGTAISVASMRRIPVYNLEREDHRADVVAWLDTLVQI